MSLDTRRAVIFTVLIGLAFLWMPAEKAQASAYQNWNGVWITSQGELKLQQTDKTVSGAYCSKSGLYSRIEGVLVDEWGFGLRGKYHEGIESGPFEFRMVESNQSFQGWLNTPDNTWTGKHAPDSYSSVKQQTMTVVNNSPHHITAIFVCPANSEDWQEVLGAKELRHGQQRNVVFKLDGSVCRWDIRVVDSSGLFTTFQNLQIEPDFTSIDYYYKNGSGHIRFAVG